MTTLAKEATPGRAHAASPTQRRGANRKPLIIGGAIVFIAAILFLRGTGGHKKDAPPPSARPVETAKVIAKDVPLYLDEIGTCAAFETVQVQAQVNGQIIAREFQDGSDVKKGDVLFRIDPRPYEATLASAQADAVLQHANFQRQTELRAKQVVAGQEIDVAKANAMKADAAVSLAQVNLDHCTIRSPINGRVGLRNVDVGNIVSPSTPPLVMIQNLDPIYTDFSIAEPDVPLVRRYLNGPKLEVLTDAEDDNVGPRSGELSFIDNAVQAGSGTVKARATTANADHALWPSQFVRVRLVLETLKGAKLVPGGAVQIGQNGPYVFVVKPDSTLDLRQVKAGQRQGDLVVVTEGVEVGESVVVSGQLQLAPGTKVIAKEAGAAGQQQPLERSGGGGAKTSK
ncbi:MAG: efflux RND transporter periplasmic adaptor subunit [Verrucomicrobiota bacterium]|nr:efflux RND transporter periplasmic adaptor subunit [Verrucomicrobiota bacterium]